MKVSITNLKAPWPAGSVLGSVVEFQGENAPAWALGKFTPAPDDADAVLYEPAPPVEGPGPVLASIGTVNLEVAQLKDSLQLARAAVQSLEAENADLTEQLGAANARIATFEAEKAKGSDIDAQASAEAARAALEAEARELGVEFRPNIGDDKLRERIAEARAAK